MATIFGTTGNDTINGSFSTPTTSGADTIYGLGGDDFIVRSLGNDTIDGGTGFDTLDFSGTANIVVVNVNAGLVREITAAGLLVKADAINSIEEFRTGSGNDVLQGYGADENFAPGLGADQVRGGDGFDTLIYTAATARVFVDLARGFALDWGGFRDALDSIESARGGAFNDVLRGGADFNFLRGNQGNDTLISGYDGTASFNGSIGVDYSGDPAGVAVDLKAGTATDGWGNHDLLVGNFFTARGSAFADTLLGNDFSNGFRPRGGADIIDGRGGYDRVDYRDEANTDPDADGFVVTASIDAAGSGTARDASGALDQLTSIEWLRGSNFNDSLAAQGFGGVTFGAYTLNYNNTPALEGRQGSDTLTGEAGDYVIVRYTSNEGGAYVDLAGGFAIDEWGFRDTLTNVWGVYTGSGDDTILLGPGDGWARPGDGTDHVDGGAGIDRVSYDGAPAGVVVDLAAGTAQDGWGNIDTLIGIEALTGSGFDDTLLGDANANWFYGGAGNDTIDGRGGIDTAFYFYLTTQGAFVDLTAGTATTGSGNDTLVSIENVIGSSFSDSIVGAAGDNALYGYLGDDSLAGLAGNDLLDGGDGTDTADYSQAASRVVVNLTIAAAQNTVGAGTDTLVSIENVLGSAFNDTLTGNDASNGFFGGNGTDTIFGGNGDDFIDGGLGDDILQGNAGTDWVGYGSAITGVTVSLALQGAYQNTVGAGNDYIAGFENLGGSAFADTLTGNASANVIDGSQGDDTLNGGDGDDTLMSGFVVTLNGIPVLSDNDTLAGGNGTDTASYENLTTLILDPGAAPSTEGVRVSLLLQGAAQDTVHAGLDTLSGIENLTGSALDDHLTGDAGNNILKGGAGDDILEGGLGTDILNGGDGIDLASYAGAAGAVTVYLNAASATGAAGTDYFTSIEGFIGSAFNDTLVGNTGNDVLQGGLGADRLYGLGGDDMLRGGAGNDLLYGDAGSDTADYADATLTVRVVLGTGGSVDTINYGNDSYFSIENIVGGSARDFLTGDANANRIEGRDGNDVIVGAAGDDTILAGAGDDDITGGLGADAIDLGAATGFDIIRYATAADSRVAAMDRITGFTQSGAGFDRIGLENNPNALFAGVTATAIAVGPRVVIEGASTMDDLVAQLTGLSASTASTLSVTQVDVNFGGAAGRYIVVNDTTAAFDATTDMLINVGMAAGSTNNLTSGNFFLY